MAPTLISSKPPLFVVNPGTEYPLKYQTLLPVICCAYEKKSKQTTEGCRRTKSHVVNPVVIGPNEETPLLLNGSKRNQFFGSKNRFLDAENADITVLCGLGYYVNGFRGFPWLALNYHMAHNLNVHPSALQLVQNAGNLPMVAKPLYGILSDTLYIGGARRIPYIAIGVFLQALSWGSLALIPIASEDISILMACVIVGNLGAAISEVAKDALIAEYGQKNGVPGLQSYAFMASAVGGVLGNLLGGFFLKKTQKTKSMFLSFVALLLLQLTVSSKIKENSLGLPPPSNYTRPRESIPMTIQKQYSSLLVAIKDEGISRPLVWVVLAILAIPTMSGSLFCYQTQCLNLDPLVIGLSKVSGQLLLLTLTILYDRFWKTIPLRKLAFTVQIFYAFSLLLDLVLVKQLNVKLGIPNVVFALCFSGLAETIACFKLLPFYVYFASLASPGCEASLLSFLASTLCLSSIFSGLIGVGLASFLGITSGDYSNLPLGIVIQFVAALLPLRWINYVPVPQVEPKDRRIGRSKKNRRNRRVGRVMDEVHSYRREREPDLQR